MEQVSGSKTASLTITTELGLGREAGPDSGVAWHVRVPGLAHMLAKGLSGRHHRGYTDPRTANSGRVPERVERTTLLMVRAATWLFYSLAEYMMLWGLSYPICQTEEQ